MWIKTFPVDHSTHIFTFTSEAAAYLALDYTDAENPVLKSLPEVSTKQIPALVVTSKLIKTDFQKDLINPTTRFVIGTCC